MQPYWRRPNRSDLGHSRHARPMTPKLGKLLE
jgi:hypothetical protein